MKKFWNWKNQEGTESQERVLEINGVIAEDSWFEDDVTPKIFKDELHKGSGPLTIWINSPGGDLIAASQIYTMLLDYKGEVTVKIDGLAASAASVIAMAGTKVLMSPTATMMIHDPSGAFEGTAEEHKYYSKVLEEFKESIINAYEIKTRLPRDQIKKLMSDETWMDAHKAIDLGFADGLLDEIRKVNPAESYAFSTRNFEFRLFNLIKEKQPKEPEPTKTGRKIEELKNELLKIKQFL